MADERERVFERRLGVKAVSRSRVRRPGIGILKGRVRGEEPVQSINLSDSILALEDSVVAARSIVKRLSVDEDVSRVADLSRPR